MAVTATVGFGGVAHLMAANASDTSDASEAVRYDTSRGGRQVFGYIPENLWDEDDDAELIEMPFPINYFGKSYTHACVTTNGLINPANAGDSCSNRYDRGVGDLSLRADNPSIAVLALDLDGGEDLALGDGRDIGDLDGSVNATLSGGVLTLTSSSHSLVAGDHVAFIDTRTVLDRGGSYPVTVIDSSSFTIPLPGVTDLDPTTDGAQTDLSRGTWTYSNGVGTRAVYVGETTVNGAPAFVVTWYRFPHNDGENPDDRSSTLQLVLIKGDTGSAGAGWDFTVEYNIGTMTDDEDGYKDTNPGSSCDAWSNSWSSEAAYDPSYDQRSQCRWGMGFGSFKDDIGLSSIQISNGIATLTTATPHGADDTGIGVRLELPEDSILGELSGATVWARKVDATKFRVDTGYEANPALFADPQVVAPDMPATDLTGLTMDFSDVYELFSGSSIDKLIDSAGTTALVRNSLNSSVLGRYRFGMAEGSVKAFVPPTMDGTPNVAPGIPSDAPTTTTTAPPAQATSTTVASSSEKPAPVRDKGGKLPKRKTGEIEVLRKGKAVKVTVSVVDETNLVVRGTGFEMRLSGECESKCTIQTTGDGRQVMVLEKGGMVNVSGFGFKPNSPVYVWMFSKPTLLGSLTADDEGRFSGQVPLGKVAVGEHTLQVNGTSSDGSTRTANLGVVVSRDGSEPLPTSGGGLHPLGWALLVLASGWALRELGRRHATA